METQQLSIVICMKKIYHHQTIYRKYYPWKLKEHNLQKSPYNTINIHIYIVPPANFVLNLGSRFFLLHQEDDYTIYSPTLPPFNNIASPNNQNTHLLVIKSTNLHYYAGQWK